MNRLILIAISSIALTSCNKTWFERTAYKEHSRVSKRDVIAYTDGRPVPKGAEEIGIINWKASSERKAVRRSRREGAIHGANAIYYIPYKGKKPIERCNHGKFYAVYQAQ